jgi:hypothetical protein
VPAELARFRALHRAPPSAILIGMTHEQPVTRRDLHEVARDWATRSVVAVGLAGIALIHLLDSIGKYGETRYIFWMYVALMVASLATAFGVLHTRTRAVWLASGGLAASAVVGYVLSRTTGLPNATGDIGNWTEPLGLASLFVEGLVIAVSGYALTLGRRAATVVPFARAPRLERQAA